MRKLRSVSCNIEEELKEIINVCKEDEQVSNLSKGQDMDMEHETDPIIVRWATTKLFNMA